MKRLLVLLIGIISLVSCNLYDSGEIGNAYTYMGGGKWVFYDYDIIVISSISNISVIKNDTICISAFNEQSIISGNVIMGQNYANIPKDRRFVRNKTEWEFDGMSLYCEFDYSSGMGLRPAHKAYYVEYGGNYLYKTESCMKITNTDLGSVTNYTFETNNVGMAPPNKLTLLSPEIVTDLYHSNGARDKAVTVRVLLKFMR